MAELLKRVPAFTGRLEVLTRGVSYALLNVVTVILEHFYGFPASMCDSWTLYKLDRDGMPCTSPCRFSSEPLALLNIRLTPDVWVKWGSSIQPLRISAVIIMYTSRLTPAFLALIKMLSALLDNDKPLRLSVQGIARVCKVGVPRLGASQ